MKKGFTLVELVVIMLIVGIIAFSFIQKISEIQTAPKIAGTKAALNMMRAALSEWFDNKDGYPTTAEFTATGAAAFMQNGPPLNNVTGTNAVLAVTGNPGVGALVSYGWYYNESTGSVWAANDTTW